MLVAQELFDAQLIKPKKEPKANEKEVQRCLAKHSGWENVKKLIDLLLYFCEVNEDIEEDDKKVWLSTKLMKRYLNCSDLKFAHYLQCLRRDTRNTHYMELANKPRSGYRLVTFRSPENLAEFDKSIRRINSHYKSDKRRRDACLEDVMLFASDEIKEKWIKANKIFDDSQNAIAELMEISRGLKLLPAANKELTSPSKIIEDSKIIPFNKNSNKQGIGY
jgi:hypothetical protein